MAAISLRNIEKAFGTASILAGIDLDIADGEFVALVGPSGCGKSTLLRIIAGLEDQSSGDVLIDGRNVAGVRPSARDLAMVFQSYALYPHLSVERNMMAPLLLRDLTLLERLPLIGRLSPARGRKLRSIHAAVSETARTLKIEPLLQRKPGQLSGGQRQRVALGRAMVRQPVAFLMDEPLSNLDAALRVHMRAELAELHGALGTTFIYVTHDQAEALTMSDRIAVMMGGQILQVASPDEIYDEPCDLRVAEFIGSPKINTLPATVDADGRIDVLGWMLPRRLAEESRGVTVAIRPEHVEIGSAAREQGLGARVTYKENLGSDVFIHATLGKGSPDGVHRVIVRSSPEVARSLEVGAAVQVRPDPAKTMVFATDNTRLTLLECAAARVQSSCRPAMAGA